MMRERNLGWRTVDPMPLPENHFRSFPEVLQAHLEEWRSGVDGSRRRYWDHWTDGVYQEYRELALAAVRDDEVRLHRYAGHLRSSQVFAFNLFLPFREGNREHLRCRVSETVGASLTIEEVRFEWVPPGHILGELNGDRPVGNEAATGVDVVLWGRLPDGARCAVLIEVKLSETDFTPCNGRTSPGNRRRDVCDSTDLFFTDPSACYLSRPLHQQRDRRYWEIFAGAHGTVAEAFPGADRAGPCPFAFSMQQPMRNLAVARGLEQDRASGISAAWFMLCAHAGNPAIDEHWREWQGILPDASMAPLLPASEIVTAGEDEGLAGWAKWMRDRYLL